MLATMPAKAVARELLRTPNDSRWSREISNAIMENTGEEIRRGSVGRILSQMENEGWLHSWRESRDECPSRIPRLYFRIEPDGIAKLQEFLGENVSLIAVGQ